MPSQTILVDERREVTSNLILEWLANRRIVVFTITAVDKETVDVFINLLDEVQQQHPTNQLRLMLFDVSNPNFGLTPYLRKQIDALEAKYPPSPGRTTIVLSKSIQGYGVRLYLKMEMLTKPRKMEIKAFFSRDEALAWLLEALQ